MRVLRLASLAVAVPMLCAQTAGVNDLVAAQRKQLQAADFRASGQLVRVQANGVRVSVPITVRAHWFLGLLRMRVEIGAPGKPVAGPVSGLHLPVHLLMDLRADGQNAIWIAHPGDQSAAALPFAQWSDGPLGPDFSYEDFLEEQYFWPNQASAGKAKLGARDCEIVKSTPGPGEKTHYSEVRTWIDPSIGFPVYAEKTMKGSGAVKEFTSFGLRHEQGQWSAHQVEVKTRGQAGSTLLIIDRGSARANLTAADFSLAQLTKF
ncbi:MAG: outer membrane lipoprotein-sorting protein [Terracidiphilus sp.]